MNQFRRGQAVEFLLVVTVFVAALVTAVRYLADQRPNPYGDFLSRAAMVACNHGFVAPGSETPAFLLFYSRQTPEITCQDVAGDLAPVPPGSFADNHRNLVYVTAFAMRAGGLRWSTLDFMLAVLFAISMTLAYGLLRLGVGRILALLGIVIFGCSDHIFQLTNLRDYSKEPWFLAAWLLLGWLIIRRGERASAALYLPACLGGAVVGFGIGFRVDLMACLPAFPAVIALAVRGWDRRALATKALAIAGFALVFGVTAAPTLLRLNQGSNSGHVAVLGLTNSFTKALGIEPPLYEVGDIYSDGFAHSLIAAHAVVVQHDPVQAFMGTSEYDRQGFAVLLDNARNFPADQAIRMAGATVQAIRYPFTEASRTASMASAMLSQTEPFETVSRWRERALGWFEGYELLLAVLVLAFAFARDWRVGAAVLSLVTYFCGYSMIQYSRRHVFHLDILPIAVLLLSIQILAWLVVRGLGSSAALAPIPTWRQAGHRLAGLAAFVAVALFALWAVRTWQQRHVASGLEHTLVAAWQPIAAVPEAFALMREGVVEPTWGDIYRAHPERWGQALTLFRVASRAGDVPASPGANQIRSDYWRVDVDSSACAFPVVSIGMKYTGPAQTFDWEYTRTFELPTAAAGGVTTLLAPAIYWAGQSAFDGFVVPSDQAACVRGVSRMATHGAAAFPFLAVVLPPDWQRRPWYQRLAWQSK